MLIVIDFEDEPLVDALEAVGAVLNELTSVSKSFFKAYFSSVCFMLVTYS